MRRKSTCAALLILTTVFLAGATLAQEEEAPAPPPGEAAAAAPAAGGAEGGISILDVIEWGGWIGYIIIGLSVLTVMLVVKSFFSLRESALVPAEVQEQVEQHFRQRKIKEALEFCREDGSLLSRVVEAGLLRVRGGWPAMEMAMSDVAEEEGLRLQQQVGWFSLIAAVAPMLGLLGTVTGMIGAFYKIALETEIKSVGPMAGDIQEALVTTFFGLIVAIPNVWAYTAFRNRLDRLMMDLSIVATELMAPFKGLRAAPTPARAAAARPAAASVAAVEEAAAAEAPSEAAAPAEASEEAQATALPAEEQASEPSAPKAPSAPEKEG